MNTLKLIRAGLRVILTFAITALVIMGAGITEVPDENMGTAVALMGAVTLIAFSAWYTHGVIDAMYHAENTRRFYNTDQSDDWTL